MQFCRTKERKPPDKLRDIGFSSDLQRTQPPPDAACVIRMVVTCAYEILYTRYYILYSYIIYECLDFSSLWIQLISHE